jgi:VIT1/CCC1 family predicted Fe2+/Mn2+ transporter
MKLNKEYLRSSVLGFEDSLVSTTGVVVGISIGTSQKEFIILAGMVTIAVEAISMAAGEYLAARTVQEADRKETKIYPFLSSIIMFFSYFIGGMIPLFPALLLNPPNSMFGTLISAGVGLFILGYAKGKVVKISPTRSAFEMLIIGGAAAIIGVVAGYLLRTN